MTTADIVREEAVNALLGERLRNQGLDARAERRGPRGVPDVRITLRTGDLVLLDCKWDGSTSLLEDQLDKRLSDFPEALTIVCVLYPPKLKRAANTSPALEAATDIQWWCHGFRGTKHGEPPRSAGSDTDLADRLRTLELELESVDRVVAAAKAIGHALGQAAHELSKHPHFPPRRGHHRQHRSGEGSRGGAPHRMSGAVQYSRVPGPTRRRQRRGSNCERDAQAGAPRTERRLAPHRR